MDQKTFILICLNKTQQLTTALFIIMNIKAQFT